MNVFIFSKKHLHFVNRRMSMNSFSEQSYKAALLKRVEPKAMTRESDLATKRKGETAPAAPPTEPTVPRKASPQVEAITSPRPPSDAFTTPSPASSKLSQRAQALAMSSPPRKLELGEPERADLTKRSEKKKKCDRTGFARGS
jgi:hypothetical protein